jgi:hypothetical protein
MGTARPSLRRKPPLRLDPGTAVMKDFKRPLLNPFAENAAKPCA